MIRLLIADDEMLERMVLNKTLVQNLGDRCQILQAENGRQALELYEKEKPQILILDIEMPGITGIEAAQKIREKDKNCCIIFLTAFDDFSYAKKAISVHALEYLLKPFDEQEMMLVVEEAIRQAEQIAGAESDVDDTAPENEEPDQEGNTDVDDPKMTKVTEEISRYIRENYVRDISMQDAARYMNYSEAYFSKLFKHCFGKNFTAYLTGYRVEMAKKLLAQADINIKEVGFAVGYQDSGYFTKVFKRITGKNPTEYRNEKG
jgi:YesN/AraC family two-component response regulator